MWQIREWRIPQNYNEVQKSLGLVQYLALYMPDIMAYMTPLSGLVQNNQIFQWTLSGDNLFLGVFPTPTSDTFSILWTPTTSKFQRCFRVLLIPSPFQQSLTLLHAPSTLTPRTTPPLKAAPRPPPPPKVALRPLQTPHPLI